MKTRYMGRMKYFYAHNKLRTAFCQLVFLSVTAFVALPTVYWGFRLAVRLSGYNAVTKENFMSIMRAPGTIVYLAVLALLLLFSMLLDITMYVVMFDSELRHKRSGLFGYLAQVEKHYVRFFRKNHPANILYMLPLALAVYLPALLVISYNNSVAKYLLKLWKSSVGKFWFYGGFFLVYMVCIWILVTKFPYIRATILGDRGVYRLSEKTRLPLKEKWRHFRFQLLWELGTIVLCIAIYAVFLLTSILVLRIRANGESILILFYEVYENINLVATVLTTFFCGMLNLSCVLQISRPRSYMRRAAQEETGKQAHYVVVGLLLAVSLLAVYLNIRWISEGTTTYDSLGAMLVTAHRGASSDAPENTLPAIEKAIEEGADYVEIDVRLTADGEVVLMHDASTKRTAGVDLQVADTTYAELQTLDVSGDFADEYPDTRIPTLAEAIEVCKGRIRMNIELKTVENDGELEEKVVQLITENHMEEQCIVTSFKQKSLLRVKEANEDIVTGYIYSFGYSNRTNYRAMDVLSIDARYLTRQVVIGAHKKGITICAWTVNTASEMRRMMAIGVDNIITDHVQLARKTLKYKDSNPYDSIIEAILKTLRQK